MREPSYDIAEVRRPRRDPYPVLEARVGLELAHRASGFRGVVVGGRAQLVVVRGVTGDEREFRLDEGAFSLRGVKAATLAWPRPVAPAAAPERTASGSLAADGPRRAQVARASRLLVEGVHDAELVEKVWGDDLRAYGIVVMRLDGIDDLAAVIDELAPGPGARLGVLVDHLVTGSKEARLAAAVRHPHVLVTGTPFVDVWQAVRPSRIGIAAWPDIPRGTSWKGGICAALGVAEPALMWRRLLAAVRSYEDLEPELVGAVEQLLDFVLDDVH